MTFIPGRTAIVLGAGIGGLAAADQLARAGWQVKVIEKSASAGGTHRARHIGDYTFDVGAIFYEEQARIFDLVPGAKAACPSLIRMQRRITPDGTIRHYPLDPREFLRQPPALVAKSTIDLLWSRATVAQDGTLDAISRKRIGRSFFENSGLSAYIERFHHVPAREIDESFFFHRMGHIARMTRFGALAKFGLRSIFSSAPFGAKTRRPLYVRPREGFSALFSPLVKRLEDAGTTFSFNDELRSVRQEHGCYVVESRSGTCIADAVISTIPIDVLHRAVFGEGSGLISLNMTTLFVSAARLDPRLGNVFFNFHPQGWWKRATIYSRIYADQGTEREFLAVEITISPSGSHEPEAAFEDFARHMYDLGFAEDLKLEGHELVEDCYPLYSPGSQHAVSKVLDRLVGTGLILAGRQGRFEYLPTSTGVIRRVVEELERAEISAEQPEIAA